MGSCAIVFPHLLLFDVINMYNMLYETDWTLPATNLSILRLFIILHPEFKVYNGTMHMENLCMPGCNKIDIEYVLKIRVNFNRILVI